MSAAEGPQQVGSLPAPRVTLDIWRLPARDVPRAMVATAWWNRRPGRGQRFRRLLGTGDTTFSPRGADPTRWVALTVWDDEPTTLSPRFARHARDHARALLVPLTARGRWARRSPFDPVGRVVAAGWDGEVLAVTRARLRPRRALAFHRAVPPVAATLAHTPGLRASFGVGEAPVAFQGTVSLWEDSAAVSRFAWRDPEHRAVVDRTPRERWYAEELFARFAVTARTPSLSAWTTP